MNAKRIAMLERAAHAAGESQSEAEAIALLDCITDAELEALAGGPLPDEMPHPSERGPGSHTSNAALAKVIFDATPGLLETCQQRLNARNELAQTTIQGRTP